MPTVAQTQIKFGPIEQIINIKKVNMPKRVPWNKGKKGTLKHSEETKKKMSLSHIGHPISEEAKKKISAVHKGKKLSSEHKQKMSLSRKGKPWSENRKISQISVKSKRWLYHIKKSVTGHSQTGHSQVYDISWNEIRKEIYKRDSWTCRECDCKCLDKKRKIKGKKIQCHHIDYDTTNNKTENLITLCASCHMKTNFKRDNWIKYYKNKIRKGKKLSCKN